jgi:hypothetical protein
VGVLGPVLRLHTERRECMGMEAVASLHYLLNKQILCQVKQIKLSGIWPKSVK